MTPIEKIEQAEKIQVHDLKFQMYLSAESIQQKVKELSVKLTEDYKDKKPLFVAILNGSFIFAADITRACAFDSDITFVKFSSYEGTGSTGNVKSLIGLNESIEGRDLIIIEDIVDTGNTLSHFLEHLEELKPASVALVTLLLKPDVFQNQFPIQYVGFEIPNKFVIGYGLDYNSRGRTFGGIYQLCE